MTAEATTLDPGSQWADFAELTKPRITLMVALTTAAGFMLAASRPLPWDLLINTLLGTALIASGASTLNQVIERRTDARMRRTANRPIPAGRLAPSTAMIFGLALSAAGAFYLALAVNLLTGLIGALTLASYVLIYTPLKRKSSLATLVGAVPGAAPPMMGCTAASGELDALAWALFGILFFWQMPHFLAIAWIYRTDYERGGFPLLTLGNVSGPRTARQMMLYAAALIPVSLLPNAIGVSGWPYFIGALLLGLAFLGFCVAFSVSHTSRAARRLLLASVVYLPIVLGLMVADQALR